MTPFVMVHGFMGGSAQWAAEKDLLSDIHDVIPLDLPGFGANNHLPAINTIAGFADWVIAELDSRGVQECHLMGHCSGSGQYDPATDQETGALCNGCKGRSARTV